MNKIKFFQFLKAFRIKFKKEGIYRESAALTFVTLMGFIPFIIFLLFFLPELPFLKLETHLSDILISIFLPESAEQISIFIKEIANQKISFNLFSFIVLLITSYSLFKIINDSFDNILNVHETRKRGLLFNFIKFMGMTVFGSLLILLLLSTTSIPIVTKFTKLPYLQSILLYFTPFFILFIIFSLGFSFIPTVRVKSRSIFIGSAVAATFWIIFKSIFNWYIFTFTNTKLIFGILASIPIFFFWIYANWIIMLCGVIIVSILEGRHNIVQLKQNDMDTIKLTFEKQVHSKNHCGFKQTTISKDELTGLLKEFLQDEEKEKKRFTEKDE